SGHALLPQHAFPTRRSSDLSFCYGRRNASQNSFIERLRNEIVSTKGKVFISIGALNIVRNFFLGESCERHGGSFLHLFVDLTSRSEEHTSELQSRETLVCRL